MDYAIICDARNEKGQEIGIRTLAMVDRSKRRDVWWTSDDADSIMRFANRGAAERKCRSLRHNYPRVVSFADAVKEINEQDEAASEASGEFADLGWDGHKYA